MAKALVTGASGFIGGQLASALAARGDEVVCLVRTTSRIERLKTLGVQIVEADVTAPETLDAAVAGADVVYHLAGLIRARGATEYLAVNGTGTANLLDACRRRTSPPTVVQVSSLAAAGSSPRDAPRTETDPPAPRSSYGRSKRAGELAAVARAADLPITIVRPPIVLGEGDVAGLIMFRMVARRRIHLVPGLARSRFSVVHVADLIDALIEAARRGTRLPPANRPMLSPGAEPAAAVDPRGYYFVAAAETPTFADLGRLVGRAVGRQRSLVIRLPGPIVWICSAWVEILAHARGEAPYLGLDKTRDALAGDWTCSAARAAAELGFAPAADLVERLRQTNEWYRREGWL